MKIVTSINPFDRLDIQLDAMKSWKGCEVYSLNSKREIEILSKYNFIKYIETSNIINNKYIRLDEVISLCASFDDDYVAIINSDIYLSENISLDRVTKHLNSNNAIVGTRYDMKSNNSLQIFPHGYDVFIFNKKHLEGIKNDTYGLGLPWWDYYFPLELIKNGVILNYINDVAFIHKYHETRYDHQTWLNIGNAFRTHMSKYLGNKYDNVPIYQYCSIVKQFLDDNLKKVVL